VVGFAISEKWQSVQKKGQAGTCPYPRAPGMTHSLAFQLTRKRAGKKTARRYRTEGQRQQGKGGTRNGPSGGSMRQNLCT